ncbi:MAG: hypothetical protein K0S07_1790 [Chlamydiales bacterium]|jgi:hypothetical protein|nr:hypothetical protein [Chlamydiales bacterium]
MSSPISNINGINQAFQEVKQSAAPGSDPKGRKYIQIKEDGSIGTVQGKFNESGQRIASTRKQVKQYLERSFKSEEFKQLGPDQAAVALSHYKWVRNPKVGGLKGALIKLQNLGQDAFSYIKSPFNYRSQVEKQAQDLIKPLEVKAKEHFAELESAFEGGSDYFRADTLRSGLAACEMDVKEIYKSSLDVSEGISFAENKKKVEDKLVDLEKSGRLTPEVKDLTNYVLCKMEIRFLTEPNIDLVKESSRLTEEAIKNIKIQDSLQGF